MTFETRYLLNLLLDIAILEVIRNPPATFSPTVMMVSDKLPATSNTVPVLGQYYIGLICIQFTATYVTTWTLGLQMQGNTGRSLPCRLRAWIMRIDLHSNCLLRNFLGRELRCIQRSIRKRMRNFVSDKECRPRSQLWIRNAPVGSLMNLSLTKKKQIRCTQSDR